MEIIVSLTTSPKRILLMEPVINSILNQSIKPTYIRINIPKVFNRTNKKYIIPDFINNNNKIKIYKYENDLGPIMKILPTILESKINNIYIYCDDDILWLPRTIEGYMNFLKDDDTNIYCYSGFNFINNEYIEKLELREIWYKNKTKVDIPEGYLSVCMTGKISNKLKQNIQPYYNKTTQYTESLTCDDIILGNFYLMNNINIIKIKTEHMSNKIWWKDTSKELEYGLEDDALQNINEGSGHIKSYKKVYNFLKKNNILYIS